MQEREYGHWRQFGTLVVPTYLPTFAGLPGCLAARLKDREQKWNTGPDMPADILIGMFNDMSTDIPTDMLADIP